MAAPRSGVQTGLTYLGWRHELLVPDPGPAPRRPAPPERAAISEEWRAAQRRHEARTNRPLTALLALLSLVALACVGLWPVRILPGLIALGLCLACLAMAAPIVVALMQSRQVMAERLRREGPRLAEEQERLDAQQRERLEEHARRYAAWQTRKRAFEAQPRWYGVRVPEDAGTVVVAGGTESGWSALLTTLGASRLRSGRDLTVVDLSGRALAGDLMALVKRSGITPRIRVLPADLQRLHLGTDLDGAQRARILSSVASALDPKADIDIDEMLLLQILDVVGPGANVSALIGGLRALAEPAEGAATRSDPALMLLSPEQRAEIRERCGSDRPVMERAWELERHIAPFEGIGTRCGDEPYAQIKVIATDRASGAVSTRAYGTYAVAALRELLELRSRNPQSAQRALRPWANTIVVCGADVLPAAEIDRLIGAASWCGAGLVLMIREVGERTAHRLAAHGVFPVLMRQPTSASAARAASWLATGRVAASAAAGAAAEKAEDVEVLAASNGHRGAARLPMHQLTEVIGEALNDAVGEGYVAEDSEGITAPVPVRTAAPPIAPLNLAQNMRAATAWGRVTTQATEIGEADGTGPVNGYQVDPHGLRTLPPTAMVVPGDAGPVLADANPGILTLPTATLSTVEESRGEPARPPEPPTADPGAAHPNVGPPPERLDWRTV
ncbi:hypothetical protein [Nocardiopsis gilva]|uniref:hypothetical protein n=1 Tax=Nocardiopsis gilva TaxID=280236 RepID=UPI00034B3CB4|nr:hypothetical protein [Nocardiopsis gilva]